MTICQSSADPIRVLLVEDDRLLRQLAVEILRDDGIPAAGVDGADQALNYLERSSGIDVLVTDINMPGMNGLDLAKLVQQRISGIRVLVISGRGRPDVDPLPEPWSFLAKPFSAQGFLTRVRELLAR